MIDSIITSSVRSRWLVLFMTIIVAVIGAWQLNLLPIDVTPDITNKQVQINTVVPTLSPVEIEKRVTYPIETALSGLAGVETVRSFSRNGFSQVTAIFKENTDLYFMRQQVSERLARARADLLRRPNRRWVRCLPGLVKCFTIVWSSPILKAREHRVTMARPAGKVMAAF